MELAAERVKARLEDIRQRGMLDETLVVLTANHGELLGEYGFLGNGKLACPELMYVPTLFCVDVYNEQTAETAISHLDLIPTMASIFDVSLPQAGRFPGKDLTQQSSDNRIHYNRSIYYRNKRSAWHASGGYVFSEDSLIEKIALFWGQISRLDSRYFIRRYPLKGLTNSIAGVDDLKTFGDPGFNKVQSKGLIESIRTERGFSERQPISEEERERLES